MWLITPQSCLLPASVPASGCSTLDSPSLYQALSRSCTWRGKSRRPESWRRACRTVPWLAHLSGLTSAPSTDGPGLEEYLRLLPACPASPTPLPASSKASRTRGALGKTARAGRSPSSSASWQKFDPPWSSSKTSQPGLWADTSDQSEKNYQAWVTSSRNRCSSLRKTLAQAIAESGSSSWPMPRTVTGGAESAQRKKELGREDSGGGDLQAEAQGWCTPTADRVGSRMDTQLSGDGRTKPNKLGWQVAELNWPTARAEDAESCGNHPGATKNWPTPMAQDSVAAGSKSKGHFLTQAAVTAWPTPNQRDFKGQDIPGRHGGTSLSHATETGQFSHSSPPDPTLPAGPTSSPLARRLNPRFVEWLMGWPPGWTAFEPLATGSYPYRPRLRQGFCLLMRALDGSATTERIKADD